jgi:hypothetical protein
MTNEEIQKCVDNASIETVDSFLKKHVKEPETWFKIFTCQCKTKTKISVPAKTNNGIYINEQPCTNCGNYMGTIESYGFGGYYIAKRNEQR